MRLTLRTLLAYLDDTLEPSEIKQIGQKVAESDAAQELIARIKQVTRRRRLTTPPATGPNSFEPNTVAEYLDNEISGDQLAEVEKLCLESDVHLAEISACHQILTLVLGEPALVPPTAKERMYGLVQGREAIPFRKAQAPAGPHGAAPAPVGDADADEMLLLGLPFYRRNSWLRWALPLAAVLLIAALGVALYQATTGVGGDPSKKPGIDKVASADKDQPEGPGPKPPDKDKQEREEKEKKEREEKEKKEREEKERKEREEKEKKRPQGDPDKPPDKPTRPVAVKVSPASKERAELGQYIYDVRNMLPSIFMQREAEGTEGWKRLLPNAAIYGTDRLMSLPGFASEVRLTSGVRVTLRGLVREFSRDPMMDFLLESAATLSKTSDFDADLMLDRGRVYLLNAKEAGGARVRLRFGKEGSEVWDLDLHEPGTEVGIDLHRHYTRDINYLDGEDPRLELYLQVLKGRAGVRIDTYHFSNLEAPPGFALVSWDNKGAGHQGPFRIEKELPIWVKAPPQGRESPEAENMVIAVKELAGKMVGKKTPGTVLDEVLQSPDSRPANRRLAIYCMCGLDEVRRLIDALGDEDPTHFGDRDTAIFTLRRWIARDANQSRLLYDPKTKSGMLLAGQKYRAKEAEILSILLHDFSDEARQSPETYELLANYLLNDKVAIAELAFWHLRHLGVRLPPFNPAEPRDRREPAANEVRKLLADGKLPPPQRAPGGPGGPDKPPPGPEKPPPKGPGPKGP